MSCDAQVAWRGRHGFLPCRLSSLLPRGCTDIICCVALLLAIVGYVAVGIIGEEAPRDRLPPPPGRRGEAGAGSGGTFTAWSCPQLGPTETLAR